MSQSQDSEITATILDAGSGTAPRESGPAAELEYEAEYELEELVRCPSCRQTLSKVGIVRIIRGRVNFISTLPRRGYVAVCVQCHTILPANLSSLV